MRAVRVRGINFEYVLNSEAFEWVLIDDILFITALVSGAKRRVNGVLALDDVTPFEISILEYPMGVFYGTDKFDAIKSFLFQLPLPIQPFVNIEEEAFLGHQITTVKKSETRIH